MKAGSHSMAEVCSEARPTSQLVQIEVSPTHPLLLLKRALPWEALTEVMTRYWRQNGKNVDGGPGLPWDVSLYVPLVVLMLIKGFDSRQMEAYLAENVVARVFIGRPHDAQAQIRDHSNIARAYAAALSTCHPIAINLAVETCLPFSYGMRVGGFFLGLRGCF